MTSIEQELLAVESTLKKCAEQLGRLNMDNNRLQEFNEELSIDIQKFQSKVAKKAHIIEQEEKDKQIIHQKLVKAEQIKEQLEIHHSKIQIMKEQEQFRQQYEHKRQPTPKHQPSQQSAKQTTESVKQLESNSNHKHETKIESKQDQTPLQQQANKQVKKSVPVKPSPEIRASVVKYEITQAPKSQIYQNTQKGEYQPPALFLDDNESDSDSDQDNSKVLQSLKQKLKQDKEELDQQDD